MIINIYSIPLSVLKLNYDSTKNEKGCFHREEFCKTYKSTSPTINNIVSKLKKIGVFIKENGKVKVNPIISIDFKKDLTLDIKLVHEEATVNVSEGVDHQEDGD